MERDSQIRLQVTLVVTELGPGGAETQVFRIACELQRRGLNVQVVSLKPPIGYVKELEALGVQVHSLDLTRSDASFRTLLSLVKLLEANLPDVLFCFLFHANVLGSVAGRLAGVPKVVTSIRGMELGGRSRELVERLLLELRLSDCLVTNSCVLQKSFEKRGIARAGDIEVIPNAIDPQQFQLPRFSRDVTRNGLNLQPTDFLWICVANVLPVKDFFTLFRAFKLVPKNAQLIIAGAIWHRELKAELDSSVLELGIKDRVRFLGSRADIADLLHASDGFVMSSISEGTPNAILEAMAAGVCVVSTAAGGVVDVVHHNWNGFLAPVGDSDALAQQMGELMQMDATARSMMASRARGYVWENHNLSSVVDRWESLI